MGQGLQDFYFQAQRRGFARDFQLRVVQIGGAALSDSDFVMIKSTTLPGRDMQTHPVPFMGVNFQLPGAPIFKGSDGWNVKFHATQDFLIRNEFERLQLDMFDEQKTGAVGKGGAGDLSMPGFDRNIQLDLIDDQLKTIRSYYLIGCFIKSISDINYNLQGAGQPLEFDAVLAYQYWTRTPDGIRGNVFDKISDISNTVGKVTNALGGVARAGSNILRGLGGG
jgi:hypothetical protein